MLSKDNPTVTYDIGSTRLAYTCCPRTGIVEFSCYPIVLNDAICPQREFDEGPHAANLPKRWQPVYAHEPEWLTPFKTSQSPDVDQFCIGNSMRSNQDIEKQALVDHRETTLPDGTRVIETETCSWHGLTFVHKVKWIPGNAWFTVCVEAIAHGPHSVTLEYLPSFSLGRITPFHSDEAPEQLRFHRFRSEWSAEGRHKAELFEDIGIERAWTNYGRRSERFGQKGSLPVRKWFPWAAVEDLKAGVFWGVQLASPGSWQIEISKTKDMATLSGGLPSKDFGDWWITLEPGQRFTTPEAVLACVHGDLEDLCHALVSAQKGPPEDDLKTTGKLPVIFNEWCSSWGEPSHAYVAESAAKLASWKLADILVIDDGWAEKPAGADIQNNGDWVVDKLKFPGGLKETTRKIRKAGLLPGIWFEMEAATAGTRAFDMGDLHLSQDGRNIRVGRRHFWDFRNPEAQAFLAEKVIKKLKEDEFSYLKIDYNESLPCGVDGPSSPGENLRQHLLAVQDFIRQIRREVPGILIENCSSGGHRLEPSFQEICTLGQFSDAHETVSIPIIAANLHRLILPIQSLVWCVIHPGDSMQRLRYGLSATFLGQMCISGGIKDLPETHLEEIARARTFHQKTAKILLEGRTKLLRDIGASWNQPRGWQAVIRSTEDEALIVFHAFKHPPMKPISLPLPKGKWEVLEVFGLVRFPTGDNGSLSVSPMEPFSGAAIRLGRIPKIKATPSNCQ